MLVLWGDLLNRFARSLGASCPAEQPDEAVESVAVAILCAFVEHA